MAIPEHIERVDELLDLPLERKVDPETGQALVKLRDETSEKLAWRPGQWYVRRFIRPIYVHPDRQSEKAGVYVRAMPDSPIEKCKADTSVLAMVAVKKYVDHLPLYRQRQIFLFVGSPRGGKACAMALTFLQSAKAVGVNPYEYLHDIYNRIMGHPVTRLHELLPAAWKQARENR